MNLSQMVSAAGKLINSDFDHDGYRVWLEYAFNADLACRDQIKVSVVAGGSLSTEVEGSCKHVTAAGRA